MTANNEDEGLQLDNVCVEMMNRDDKNKINVVDSLLTLTYEDDAKKRKRLPHRPYASTSSRIVKKCGKYNVFTVNIPQKNSRLVKDLGNTLLSIRWRWILISLCLANAVAYLIFTILWILIVLWEESYMTDENRYPCIIGGKSFASYFILVVETITTIGSGEIYPTDCQSGWIIITFQALTGVAIEGALVTAVYVKMSRPQNKNSTRLFSRKAVICRRDGFNCLIFRIHDRSERYWAKTVIRAILIRRRNLMGGESLPYYFQNLKLEKIGLLIWPQEVVHKITQDSPFWTMSKDDLYKFRFEIMVVLEGDSSTTGQPSQSQTSYTNKEVLWGYRFSPCVEYDVTTQKYVVNKKLFNDVVKHEMAECSAREVQFNLDDSDPNEAVDR